MDNALRATNGNCIYRRRLFQRCHLGSVSVCDLDSGSDSNLDLKFESKKNDNNTATTAAKCCGIVVLVVAMRSKLYVQKWITLTNCETFVPHVAIHPSTYVNKILVR